MPGGQWTQKAETEGNGNGFQRYTWPRFIPHKKASLSSLFLLLIFLIWPALSLGQIFTRQFKFSFCGKGHGRWRRWPSFTSLTAGIPSQFSVIHAVLSHDITLPVLATGWELPDPEGDTVPLITKGNDKVVSPTTQRNWRVQLALHLGKHSYSSALQVSFPCRQLLLTCPGGVWRLEWCVLSFTSSWDISVLAERGPFFSLQWVKAKGATRFLNYSLIWPQSSPLHKYSLICSLGSQEKEL